jgi:hypothetical protein
MAWTRDGTLLLLIGGMALASGLIAIALLLL